MIKEPITFVLGAGVSNEFRRSAGPDTHTWCYPLGSHLKEIILKDAGDMLRRQNDSRMHILHPTVNPITFFESDTVKDQTNRFQNEFNEKPNPSIDDFLQYHQEFSEIGKFFITTSILKSEKDHFSNRTISNDSSIEYILRNYIAKPLEPDEKLRFVSFNYDLSLEFMIDRYLNGFGWPEEERKAYLENLKIIHPHGKLGDIHSRLYGRGSTYEQVVSLSKELTLLHEDTSTDLFEKAKEYLQSSSIIIFLGFAYHYDLMEKLGFPGIDDGKSIGGSTYRFTLPEVGSMLEKWISNPDLFQEVSLNGYEYLRQSDKFHNNIEL